MTAVPAPGFASVALDRYGLAVLVRLVLVLLLFVVLHVAALPVRFALVVLVSAAARADHHLTVLLTATASR